MNRKSSPTKAGPQGIIHSYSPGWWNESRIARVLTIHRSNLTIGVFGASDRIEMVKGLTDRAERRDFSSGHSIKEGAISGWIHGAVNAWNSDTTTDQGRAAILEAAKALRCYGRLVDDLPKREESKELPGKMDDEEVLPLDPEES